uniref:RING-type E3 ubiquitin transferase n=1 Tax=Actinia tenebrosa TaxID=6105 RepID=A0A6P8JCX5_ACTTE
MFKGAGQPELIRSNQKDIYYLTSLRENFGQLFRDFFGVHSWMKYKDEIEVFAEVCYFGLTTLSGFQTLGEEYCNIVQVDDTRRAIPSTLNRCILVCLHTLAPYFLRKLLGKLEVLVQTPERWPSGWSEKSRIWLQESLPIIQQSILFLHRAHLTIFYLTGIFYHLSKRITSINYILVRSGLKNDSSRPTYRLLGYISAIQLSLSVLFTAYKSSRSVVSSDLAAQSSSSSCENTSNKIEPPGTSRRLKCPLCLELLHDVTATPCGHLFDWQCITEWCSEKPDCPLCREPVPLSRLVYLHCFEPT